MKFGSLILSLFDFNNQYYSNILGALLLALVVVQYTVGKWAYRDTLYLKISPMRRNLLIAFATLVPVLGILVYLIFKNTHESNYRFDPLSSPYTRSDLVLIEDNLLLCSQCFSLNKKDFKYCIECSALLDSSCKRCMAHVDPSWKYCPRCGSTNVLELEKDPKTVAVVNASISKRFYTILRRYWAGILRRKGEIQTLWKEAQASESGISKSTKLSDSQKS